MTALALTAVVPVDACVGDLDQELICLRQRHGTLGGCQDLRRACGSDKNGSHGGRQHRIFLYRENQCVLQGSILLFCTVIIADDRRARRMNRRFWETC
jgi:hypothetical protein